MLDIHDHLSKFSCNSIYAEDTEHSQRTYWFWVWKHSLSGFLWGLEMAILAILAFLENGSYLLPSMAMRFLPIGLCKFFWHKATHFWAQNFRQLWAWALTTATDLKAMGLKLHIYVLHILRYMFDKFQLQGFLNYSRQILSIWLLEISFETHFGSKSGHKVVKNWGKSKSGFKGV